MRILVTGSSGTIGTRLCEALLGRGDEVVGIDWMKNKWQANVDQITRQCDLRDLDATLALSLPWTPDAVVHLAANARVYELVEDPLKARDNFLTTFNVLELARRREVPRFLFASSRECYGNSGAKRYTEDLARIENCESPYTASKIGGEALVEAYRRCYGLQQITFRFSNVYGMYDDSERVVPLFIRRAKAGEPLAVFGKDKCLDFTYIDDAISGIVAAIDRFENAANETYNIAYGEGTTILHLAQRVQELLKSSSSIEMGDPRTGEVIRYTADIRKAKKVLGYAPKTPLDQGIEKAVEWYGRHT